MSLPAPSTFSDCVDDSGTGITSARLNDLSVAFDSISCFSPRGTTGEGRATIEWSDRTTSNVDADVRLESPLTGTLRFTVTSGHFSGMTGTSDFSAFPAQGDCSSGVTLEDVQMAGIALAPV